MTDNNALTIQPVANGYIVHGAATFQNNGGPSNRPDQWQVFESFEALAMFLRKTLVAKS